MRMVAAAMGLIGIWGEIEDDGFWKTMVILSLQAGALAHSLALMLVELPAGRRWLPRALRNPFIEFHPAGTQERQAYRGVASRSFPLRRITCINYRLLRSRSPCLRAPRRRKP